MQARLDYCSSLLNSSTLFFYSRKVPNLAARICVRVSRTRRATSTIDCLLHCLFTILYTVCLFTILNTVHCLFTILYTVSLFTIFILSACSLHWLPVHYIHHLLTTLAACTVRTVCSLHWPPDHYIIEHQTSPSCFTDRLQSKVAVSTPRWIDPISRLQSLGKSKQIVQILSHKWVLPLTASRTRAFYSTVGTPF